MYLCHHDRTEKLSTRLTSNLTQILNLGCVFSAYLLSALYAIARPSVRQTGVLYNKKAVLSQR